MMTEMLRCDACKIITKDKPDTARGWRRLEITVYEDDIDDDYTVMHFCPTCMKKLREIGMSDD